MSKPEEKKLDTKAGKLGVEGCDTAWDESYKLKSKARESKAKHDKWEDQHEFVQVPIHNGVKLIERKKYERLYGTRKV